MPCELCITIIFNFFFVTKLCVFGADQEINVSIKPLTVVYSVIVQKTHTVYHLDFESLVKRRSK